ncbi:MAG: hypothetical protein K2Y71_15285 [Xanthobacteraceae bacterium]|nr:hypothetical protein [Xanthobacteraceae bacterium]
MTYQSHSNAPGAGDWLMGAVKKNPEGMLLLAAGCALLLRSGARSRETGYSARQSRSAGQNYQGGAGRSSAGVSDTVSRAAETARDYASDIGKTVSDKAGDYVAAVSDYAGEAGRTVADQSERLARQTQATLRQTMDRVLKEQPLAVAVMGLAAGAAVAAALPATDVERRTLGSAGEKLSEAASAVGENLSQAASKAGERLMQAADERGLNKDGLKEVAGEVAGAFGDTFRGDERRGSQPSGSGSSTSGQSGQSRGSASGSSPSGAGSSSGGQSGQSRGSASGSSPSGAGSSSGGQSGQSRGFDGGVSSSGSANKPGSSGR